MADADPGDPPDLKPFARGQHPKRAENPAARCPSVSDRDLNGLVKAAWAAGWWCEVGKRSHAKCYSPDRKMMVMVASTPSDHRTFMNTRAKFRRAGLDV